MEDVFYYISVLKTIQVQLGCSKMLDIVLAGPKKSADPNKTSVMALSFKTMNCFQMMIGLFSFYCTMMMLMSSIP